jgi:branched-subunit amino acid transport protein
VILALVVLAAGTFALKAVGPVLAGTRELPPMLHELTRLLPAALLAALVAVQTVGDGTSLTIDARVVGLAAAGVTVWYRAPFGVVVLVGAGVTAGVRLLGWG